MAQQPSGQQHEGKWAGELGKATKWGSSDSRRFGGRLWVPAGLRRSRTDRSPGWSDGPRAREGIFGRGQDLGWSLAFYGEETDWEGPSGEAFLLRLFAQAAPGGRGKRAAAPGREAFLPGSEDTTPGRGCG